MDYDLDLDPALAAAVLEIESHLAGAGWDQPSRLYALVDTAQLVEQEPQLAAALGLDEPAEQGSLTPIEQDELDPSRRLEEFLPTVQWPGAVVGCAAAVERLVLPPEVDAQIPEDPVQAAEFAQRHPDRSEVRIIAGVTRHGSAYCAVRTRDHDDDHEVMGGPDLVPELLDLLRGTLEEDELEENQ